MFKYTIVSVNFDKKIRDQTGVFAAALTELSRVFDCIHNDLIISKLGAFGFDKESLGFILAYLTKKKRKSMLDQLLVIS